MAWCLYWLPVTDQKSVGATKRPGTRNDTISIPFVFELESMLKVAQTAEKELGCLEVRLHITSKTEDQDFKMLTASTKYI